MNSNWNSHTKYHSGTLFELSYKVKPMGQPYDQIIPLLGIHHRKIETHVHIMDCMGIFTAALFIINRKFPKPETTKYSARRKVK